MGNYTLKRSQTDSDVMSCAFQDGNWICTNTAYKRLADLELHNSGNKRVSAPKVSIQAADVTLQGDAVVIQPLRNAHSLVCETNPNEVSCRDKTIKYYT